MEVPPNPKELKRICVYCGSKGGTRPVYEQAADQLGREMAMQGIGLVYGGGSVGLMGVVAKAVHQGGGAIIGVIPKALMPREISGETFGEIRVVANMHERKAQMAAEADAFIALPGGFGTLEELLEMVTWSQLGIHAKPVGVLNVDGFYDKLLAFFDHCVEEGFVPPSSRSIVIAESSAPGLLARLQEYTPLHKGIVDTWTQAPQNPSVLEP